ncbi:hypothetical protein BJ322DRAFT_1017987 [Thelephora terrestris]|uniref:F-box domain-containing protein n=1 Tax=Thelephora terrestris TaxID=56493 RepID=A0A9P6LAC3_9AGAM|nr:hypothetical protein BJ322DRAFT_1017987 [Thelephora terrestris]
MSEIFIPPEICDKIVDFLQNDPAALKQCCLASKSWVPRTRKHLFAVVEFTNQSYLRNWNMLFPEPSKSPARHTEVLRIGCLEAIVHDPATSDWIPMFSRIVRFEIFSAYGNELDTRLMQFRHFPHTLKSLRLTMFSFGPSQSIDLACHFPLLEDLAFLGYNCNCDNPLVFSPPLTSPALTGTLELRIIRGIARTAHRLLDLPNGLHFRNLKLSPHSEEDFPSVEKLVEACSDTLEHLYVRYLPGAGSADIPRLDLSKALKLKDIVFRCNVTDIKWVISALETIAQHRNLQQISIQVPSILPEDEMISGLWPTLDLVLVQFWESHSIRTKILSPPPGREDEHEGLVMADWSVHMLPESMGQEIIDLVEEPKVSG